MGIRSRAKEDTKKYKSPSLVASISHSLTSFMQTVESLMRFIQTVASLVGFTVHQQCLSLAANFGRCQGSKFRRLWRAIAQQLLSSNIINSYM